MVFEHYIARLSRHEGVEKPFADSIRQFMVWAGVLMILSVLVIGHTKNIPLRYQTNEPEQQTFFTTVPSRVASSTTSTPPVGAAAAVCVLDDETGAPLWDYNGTTPRPLASLTKLMSAIILDEGAISSSATTTITSADHDQISAMVRIGERYTYEELFQLALVGSSNTAVNALARLASGSTSSFVALMNAKAVRLGLSTLSFVEPTGLDPANQGSACDVGRLLFLALKREPIAKTLAEPSWTISFRPRNDNLVWNTNWLLTRWVPHTFTILPIGKTGHIPEAGYNVALRFAEDPTRRIRVVVLGAPDNESRFTIARNIALWTFENYEWPTTAN